MDISKHPILKQGYEMCLSIEECMASAEQTKASSAATDFVAEVEKLVDLLGLAEKTLQKYINVPESMIGNCAIRYFDEKKKLTR